MTHPNSTPPGSGAITPDPDDGAAGGGKAINETWQRLREDDGEPGGITDDPTGGDDGTEREPLPHRRDLPGQEIPEQDPDLPPTTGTDGDNPDVVPPEDRPGRHSTQI